MHPGESYTLPAPPTIEGYVFESMSRSGMNPGDTINYDNATTEPGRYNYHISYLYRKATEHSIDQKIDPVLIGAQVGEDGYSELDDKFPEKYIELLAGESYTFPNVEIDGYRLKKIINSGPDGNELSYKVGDVIHYRNNAGDDLDRGPYFSYVYEKVQSGSSNKSDHKSIENPADQPQPAKPEKPAEKPSEKPVVPDTPKPEVKPETKPSETPKPEVTPEPKPSETPKPEVKPAPKPSDTSKPEVKPEPKPQTNSNTAPTAPVKTVGQTSNSKADKPTSKKETPALPNTGEQSSSLSLVGLLLASLGLAGLTYKGRH